MDIFFCLDIFTNMFYVLWKCVILTTTKKIYWKGNIFAIPSMRAEWGGQWARSWLQQVCSTYICPTPLLTRSLPGWERDMGLSSLLPLFPLLTFLALCPHLVLGKADACKISSPRLFFPGEVTQLKCTSNSEQNVVVPVEGPNYQFGWWQISNWIKIDILLNFILLSSNVSVWLEGGHKSFFGPI